MANTQSQATKLAPTQTFFIIQRMRLRYLREQRGTQWVVGQAVKRAGLRKEVHTHTLRHSYATHLLEQGVNILTIKNLLGHAHIETTMVYLHIAKPSPQTVFSPLDSLYKQS